MTEPKQTHVEVDAQALAELVVRTVERITTLLDSPPVRTLISDASGPSECDSWHAIIDHAKAMEVERCGLESLEGFDVHPDFALVPTLMSHLITQFVEEGFFLYRAAVRRWLLGDIRFVALGDLCAAFARSSQVQAERN